MKVEASVVCTAPLTIEITDEDVDWVASLMNLTSLDQPRLDFLKAMHTVDVSACPGSGKTTLIVAKLAILARKWPFRTKGICVLSHTNVAREEIENRLGNNAICRKILDYPHFVGTIHGFANRFLALPYLERRQLPLTLVDDPATEAFRQKNLGRHLRAFEFYLAKRHRTLTDLRVTDVDGPSFIIKGEKTLPGQDKDSYKAAKSAVDASVSRGFYYHAEMLTLAQNHLNERPLVSRWLQRRFPVVFVDEMQDTDQQQGQILAEVFPRESCELVVQRVGDPNQAIFSGGETTANSSYSYPDEHEDLVIHVSTSLRFGNGIADLASRFAVSAVKPDGLVGEGPKSLVSHDRKGNNTVFVFENSEARRVLDEYARVVAQEFAPEERSKGGPIVAVGAVHNKPPVDTSDPHFPQSVGDYWPHYQPHRAVRGRSPETLIEYLREAQTLSKSSGEMPEALDLVSTGINRLMALLGSLTSSRRPKFREMVETPGIPPIERASFVQAIRKLLIEQPPITSENWPRLVSRILGFAKFIAAETPINPINAEEFLSWVAPSDVPSARPEGFVASPKANCFVTEVDGHRLEIQLGSIHSVKGQNHLATLVLGTYWNGQVYEKLLPWLIGSKANGAKEKEQNTRRLLQLYVAMTRPSHLLCLAVPVSSLGADPSDSIGKIKDLGWNVIEVRAHMTTLKE